MNSPHLERAVQELIGQWQRHADYYGSFTFSTALVRDGGDLKNALTVLWPLDRSTDALPNTRIADYGRLVIARGHFGIDKAKRVMTGAAEGALCLPELPVVKFSPPTPTRTQRMLSHQTPFPVLYPHQEFCFELGQQNQGYLSYNLLCDPNLPLYPNDRSAIRDLFGIRRGSIDSYVGKLVALVPDYRARIKSLRISECEGQVEIDVCEASEGSAIHGKLYIETVSEPPQVEDLSFINGTAEFRSVGLPTLALAVIFSSKDGEVIDERWFTREPNTISNGVVIETTAEELFAIIAAGESDSTEFKREFPRGKANELAVPVAAFANTKGGRVFLGVMDRSEIVGFAQPKIVETITNALRATCDPAPFVQVTEALVQGKKIVVIAVPEGPEKPYVVRDKGAYIRCGNTNRHATHLELLRMIEQGSTSPRQNGITFDE